TSLKLKKFGEITEVTPTIIWIMTFHYQQLTLRWIRMLKCTRSEPVLPVTAIMDQTIAANGAREDTTKLYWTTHPDLAGTFGRKPNVATIQISARGVHGLTHVKVGVREI